MPDPSRRYLPVGEAALLVELADLGPALTLLDLLLAHPIPGTEELIPAARSVLIRFNPFETSADDVRTHVAGLDLSQSTDRAGREVEISVSYTGPDLAELAELLGWTTEELIRHHQATDYKVAFCGFAPGFAYLSGSDPELIAPRRASPRKRIPAGSVALAGAFCGVYPTDSPGGWQLIGTTPLQMWDLARERPALLAPGDRVHFRSMTRGAQILLGEAGDREKPNAGQTVANIGLKVLRADRPMVFQDFGRFGEAAQGVSRSGAVDRKSFRLANDLVGNPAGTPALEICLGGATFLAQEPLTAALCGAPAPMKIRRIDGATFEIPAEAAFALDAGDELAIGMPKSGLFSYLALRGGLDVAPVLGSASYDTLAQIGPAPVTAGAVLAPANGPARAVQVSLGASRSLPTSGQVTEIDVILGPRCDWFTASGLQSFTSQLWRVSPDSNRVGKRLSGAVAIERNDSAELPSEATVFGSIQVPHNGQPVLFLADHPLTGGYPVIAVVAAHHLDLAAQIPPGGQIKFRPIPGPLCKADA